MDTLNQIFVSLEKDVDQIIDGLQRAVDQHLQTPPEEPPLPLGQRFGRDSNFTGFVGQPPGGRTAQAPATQQVAPAAPTQRLPRSQMPKWRGLRGLWRWALYGNSHDNPDYQKYESIKPKLSLNEYAEYSNQIDAFADDIIDSLQIERTDGLATVFADFKSLLKRVIAQYRQQAANLIASAPTQVDPAAPEAETEPAPAVDPRELMHSPDAHQGHIDDTPDDEIERQMSDPTAAEPEKIDPAAQSPDLPLADAPTNNAAVEQRLEIVKRVAEKVAAKEVDDPQNNWFTPGGGIAKHALPSIVAWLINKAKNDDGEAGVNILDKREVNNALARHGYNGKADLLGRFFNFLGMKKSSVEAQSVLQSLGWKHGVKNRPSMKGTGDIKVGEKGRPIVPDPEGIENSEIAGKSFDDVMAGVEAGDDDAISILKQIGIPDDIINNVSGTKAPPEVKAQVEAPEKKSEPTAVAIADDDEPEDKDTAVDGLNRIMRFNMMRLRDIKTQISLSKEFEEKSKKYQAGELGGDQFAAFVAKASQKIAKEGGHKEQFPTKLKDLLAYGSKLHVPEPEEEDDEMEEHASLLRNETFIRKIIAKKIPVQELGSFYLNLLKS